MQFIKGSKVYLFTEIALWPLSDSKKVLRIGWPGKVVNITTRQCTGNKDWNRGPLQWRIAYSSRNKMGAIVLTTFSYMIIWHKICMYSNIIEGCFLVSIIRQQLFRQWLGNKQATSHYPKQRWPSSPTHISLGRSVWINLQQIHIYQNPLYSDGKCHQRANRNVGWHFVKLQYTCAKGVLLHVGYHSNGWDQSVVHMTLFTVNIQKC